MARMPVFVIRADNPHGLPYDAGTDNQGTALLLMRTILAQGGQSLTVNGVAVPDDVIAGLGGYR